MLLTITTTHRPATDLGYLLHKNPGRTRHRDHRFEWRRDEFRSWAETAAIRFGYAVRFLSIGSKDAKVWAPTQMGVFTSK